VGKICASWGGFKKRSVSKNKLFMLTGFLNATYILKVCRKHLINLNLTNGTGVCLPKWHVSQNDSFTKFHIFVIVDLLLAKSRRSTFTKNTYKHFHCRKKGLNPSFTEIFGYTLSKFEITEIRDSFVTLFWKLPK